MVVQVRSADQGSLPKPIGSEHSISYIERLTLIDSLKNIAFTNAIAALQGQLNDLGRGSTPC